MSRRQWQPEEPSRSLSQEEFNAAMRQTWSLVSDQPQHGPSAISLDELRAGVYPQPGILVRRHYRDKGTGQWHAEGYRVASAPFSLPSLGGNYFLGGGHAVRAYKDVSQFTGPEVRWLSAADKYQMANELHELSLGSCGVEPWNTLDGKLWTEAVWLERVS